MSPKAASTRERILGAARTLLEERGFQGFSLEEVGRAAGVTRQTVYRHFASRVGLLEGLVDYIPQVEGRPVTEGVSAVEALRRAVTFNAGYLDRIGRFAALIHHARAEVPEAAAAWRRRMEFLRSRWRLLAERLDREGMLAAGWSAEEAGDLLWAVVSFPVYEYLVMDGKWSPGRYESALTRLVQGAFVGAAHRSTEDRADPGRRRIRRSPRK